MVPCVILEQSRSRPEWEWFFLDNAFTGSHASASKARLGEAQPYSARQDRLMRGVPLQTRLLNVRKIHDPRDGSEKNGETC